MPRASFVETAMITGFEFLSVDFAASVTGVSAIPTESFAGYGGGSFVSDNGKI